MRQLTSQSGQVTYAKSYDPYGVVTQTSGAGQSAYGYTGEQQSNDMVYLRARYYSPLEGRFQSRDTWAGDDNKPMSYNLWNYVQSNPINYIDPTGYYWWGIGQALFDASDMKARSQNIHVRIQALAILDRGAEEIHAEFPGILTIPVPHVDLLDSITGEVWEIKPWDDRANAVLDLSSRVLGLNVAKRQELLKGMNPVGMPFNWNYSPSSWIPGVSFPNNVYIGRDDTGWYDFFAGQTSPGIIAWWKLKRQNKQPVPYPILLPNPVTFNERNQRSSQNNWNGNLVPQPATTQVLTGAAIVGICAYIAKEAIEVYFCGPCAFALP